MTLSHHYIEHLSRSFFRLYKIMKNGTKFHESPIDHSRVRRTTDRWQLISAERQRQSDMTGLGNSVESTEKHDHSVLGYGNTKLLPVGSSGSKSCGT